MDLKSGILNCLQDDAESFEQIFEMLEDFNISAFSESDVKSAIVELAVAQKIFVMFPPEKSGFVDKISEEEFNEFWFALPTH